MKKMYFSTPFLTWAWGVSWVVASAFLLAVMLLASFEDFCFFLILLFWAVLHLLGTLYLIKSGFFAAILVSKDEIKVRGKSYSWKDLCVTAWPDGMRSIQYQYVLYFANEYLTSKRSRKSKSICKVYLNSRNLEMILNYYTKKICVMGPDGKRWVEKVFTSKSMAQKILEHNAQVEEKG